MNKIKKRSWGLIRISLFLLAILVAIHTFVETPHYEVHFCPREDCVGILTDLLNRTDESIHCAFFSINIPEIMNLLEHKTNSVDVQLVTEYDVALTNTKKQQRASYMHNKFCILDEETVFTGSMNPTITNSKDQNNIVIIKSKKIAAAYEHEFEELSEGGKHLSMPLQPENVLFCPDDACEERMIQEIRKARHSIKFLSFVFTNEQFARVLAEQQDQGIRVEGIVEGQMLNFKAYNITVLKFKGEHQLHHKVFIIDNNTVITGSMNPSANGVGKNDENVIIIRNAEIAGEFLEEYERLRRESKKE